MPVPITPKVESLLSSKLAAPVQQTKREGPVWEGPESDGPNGGVTQSLLGRFLVCRERFRLLVVEGLKPSEGWNHRLGYGDMWHVCEEHHLAGKDWQGPLVDHCWSEGIAHPMDRGTIEHWWAVCCIQFPIYIDYWSRYIDTVSRVPLLQEVAFRVPYKLPSGRTVQLRGKWDSVDLVNGGVWLTDHKTKGDLDLHHITRQMSFDMQTMFYLVALKINRQAFDRYLEATGNVLGEFTDKQLNDRFEDWCNGQLYGSTIKGVYYNCVRRPLSGGKGTIVQKKGSKNVPAETREEFYARLGQYIKDDPEHYFMRFACEVSPQDIATFQQQCLDPILEQLCDWWDWIGKLQQEPFNTEGSGGIHYRYPFGIFNPLNEGRSTDLDNYLATGSEAGLARVSNLFPELQSPA